MRNPASTSGSPPCSPFKEPPDPLAYPTIHCLLCIQLCLYIEMTSLFSSLRAPGAISLAFCIISPLVQVSTLSCDFCLCHFNESFEASFELLAPSLPLLHFFCFPLSQAGSDLPIPIPSRLSLLSSFSLLFPFSGSWKSFLLLPLPSILSFPAQWIPA